MKILFLNAYFYPEQIAFSHLEQDLLDGLLAAGNTVEVLCPVPTRGIRKETVKAYAGKKQEQMYDGRVNVRRFWAPQEGRNPLIRAFRYFWCNLRQYQLGRKYRGVDAIFAVSTPPTQGWLAGKLSKKLNCRFIYSLQDVFPDSLVTTGLAKRDSLLWKLGRRLEDSTYQKADAIIVISRTMRKNLLEKGVPEEKLRTISNWIDTETVFPVAKEDNGLFAEFGIDKEKFTVVYAGNFGAAQGAGVVLEAAKRLPDIQFVIFGGGAEFENACNLAKQLPNVTISGMLSRERVPEVYSLGNVALITCKKGAGKSAMPSKTWSIMACNTPVVAAFDPDSELARILSEARAGVCVKPEDPALLAQAIVQMQKNIRRFSGGREYVCTQADKTQCVAQYLKVMGVTEESK